MHDVPFCRDARVAEQLRLGQTGGKGRKAVRGRQRRMRRAAAKGIKQRGVPEDVARKLGEANLLYASGQCAPILCCGYRKQISVSQSVDFSEEHHLPTIST